MNIIDILILQKDYGDVNVLCSQKPHEIFKGKTSLAKHQYNDKAMSVIYYDGSYIDNVHISMYYHGVTRMDIEMSAIVDKYKDLCEKFLLVKEYKPSLSEYEYKIIPLFEFVYGSTIYGSNDEKSDIDTFVVGGSENFINCEIKNINDFQRLLDEQDIQAIEIYSSNIENEVFTDLFKYEVNKDKLRTSISTITSNSWVKGKKKLTVMGDYDLRAGLKSVFHSIRILDFGIQIATHGKVVEWGNYNYVLKDLYKLSEQHKHHELWEQINSKYRKTFLKLSTEFKILCPKSVNESNNKKIIIDLMNQYNIPPNDEFVEAILFHIR